MNRRFTTWLGIAVGALTLFLDAPTTTWAAGPPVPAYISAVSADSPRGYWRLGEAAGSTVATDSSGNGLNGTYGQKVVVGDAVGTLLYDRDTAAAFEGVGGYLVGDDYVSMGNPAGLNFGTGDFTVEAWVSTEATNDAPIVTKSSGSDSTPRWEIVVTDDPGYEGRVRAYLYDGAPTPTDITVYGPSVRVDDGEFHHVVVVFDRDQDVIVYVDGVAARKAIAMSGNVSNSAPFRVGGLVDVPAFNGEIDDVAVYPSALSTSRVRAHYDAGLDPPEEYVDEGLSDVPTGYWRLGEAVLTMPAADVSGNGLNGAYGPFLTPGRPGALVGDNDTAIGFNGFGGVSMGDPPALDFGTDDFSVSAWMKTSVNGERVIMGKVEPSSAVPNWVVTVTDDTGQVGRVRAKIFDGLNTVLAYGPSQRVDDGVWHHIGVAFDRDVGVSLYVDGIENASPGVSVGSVSNAGSFWIGQAPTYSAFQGDIDEVAVYGAQVLHPTAFATYHDAGATPSERVIALEDPTVVDAPGPASIGDPGQTLPGYDPTQVRGARPGDLAWYNAENAAAWNEYLASGGAPESDPTIPEASPGVEIGPQGAGLEGVATDPPDTTLAAGRTRVVQVVNQRIAVYNKSDLSRDAGPYDLRNFVKHCPDTTGVVVRDPQIMWDNETRKWFYVALEVTDDQNENCLAYGWSKGPSPKPLASGWCHFTTPVTQTQDDYPKLGDSYFYIVIGTNVFGSSHPNLPVLYSRLQAIKKPSRRGRNACRAQPLYPSDPYRPIDQNDKWPLTPVPANAVNSQREAWAVGMDRNANMMWLWRVRDSTEFEPCHPPVPQGEACWEDFQINLAPWPVFQKPAPAPQGPNFSWKLNTLDGRLTQAVSLWDPAVNRVAVWTQHTVAYGPSTGRRRARLQWYELLPPRPGFTPSFRQRGAIVTALHWVFNGAISPAANGSEAMLHYNLSNPDQKLQILARARVANTPMNAFGPPQHVYTSQHFYGNNDICEVVEGVPLCAWGDYAGAAPDPRRRRRIWATNEAAGDPLLSEYPWITQNFRGRATP